MKLNLTISLLALAILSAAASAVQLPVGLNLDKDPNDKKVNVSLYVMSKCPDAVRAILPLRLRLLKSEGNVLTEKRLTIETMRKHIRSSSPNRIHTPQDLSFSSLHRYPQFLFTSGSRRETRLYRSLR